MANYQVNIDERNIVGKHFLELMKTLPFITIAENKRMKGIEKVSDCVKSKNKVYLSS